MNSTRRPLCRLGSHWVRSTHHAVRRGLEIEAGGSLGADRGSMMIVFRSHLAPRFSRSRKLQDASRETPATSSKCGLSRCHPMPAPGPYSLIRTWAKASAGRPANEATLWRKPRRKSGMSAASTCPGKHQWSMTIIRKVARAGQSPQTFQSFRVSHTPKAAFGISKRIPWKARST